MFLENCLKEIEFLLEEDLALGDIASDTVGNVPVNANIICNEKCVLAGVDVTREFLHRRGLRATFYYRDGELIDKCKVASVYGSAREILRLERTILNVLGRMSGVATLTRIFVDKIKKVNSNVVFACTRKTLLKFIDKEAVRIGGGSPHRLALGDLIMFKDNHKRVIDVENVIGDIRRWDFAHKIEVEVESLEEALRYADKVDILMLDNFSPDEVRNFIEIIGKSKKFLLEVSGGITPENVEKYAIDGVDIISSGYVSKNAKIIDFSLEFE